MSIFNNVLGRMPKYNKFNLSHDRKLTMNMGDLVPILVEECLPGDKWRMKSEVFLRMMPMLAPIMHRVNVRVEFFKVPMRLLFEGWEPFITKGRTGQQSVWPNLPSFAPAFVLDNQMSGDTQYFNSGSLWDYMGLPNCGTSAFDDPVTRVNAMPFLAYQRIWSDWYRDPNLDPELFGEESGGTGIYINLGGKLGTSVMDLNMYGTDGFATLLQLRQRCWEKDYFTSALPWTQRGADVLIPLSNETTVTYEAASRVYKSDGNPLSSGSNLGMPDNIGSTDLLREKNFTTNDDIGAARVENIDEVLLDGEVSINELRTSVRLQEWLEKNARAGYRYVEQILSHFGVRSSDARMMRAEYLGGGRVPVKISEVLSTYGEDENTVSQPGDMYGHGMAFGSHKPVKTYCEEHCYIIGILSVMPKTGYQQGIPRMYSHLDPYDFYWPEFAHLGEQPVLNKEIYYDATDDGILNNAVFGYQPRYMEYRVRENSSHGDMRTNLDFWHMNRIFESRPNLNQAFVHSDPTHRIFSEVLEDDQKLIVTVLNRVDALRKIPYYGVPTI